MTIQFKHSTPHGRQAARAAIKHVVENGEDFIAGHPFYGEEDKFPKTVALVNDLAKQLNAGAITWDDANAQADASMEAECEEHLTQRGMPNDVLQAIFGNLQHGVI
jgi:hypothetical protein